MTSSLSHTQPPVSNPLSSAVAKHLRLTALGDLLSAVCLLHAAAILAAYAEEQGTKREWVISQEEIASRTGMCRETVNKYSQLFAQYGVMDFNAERHGRYRSSPHGRKPSSYRVLLEPVLHLARSSVALVREYAASMLPGRNRNKRQERRERASQSQRSAELLAEIEREHEQYSDRGGGP